MLPLKEKDAFHARYGCTITQYIQGQRMERAEQLLANTDLPVGQIAQIVGYQNPSRFAQLFRRSTGRAGSVPGRSPTHGKQSERTRRTEKARRQEERQPPALGLLLSLKEPVNDLQSHRARYLW